MESTTNATQNDSTSNSADCESQKADCKEETKRPAGSSVSPNRTLLLSIGVSIFAGLLLLTGFCCYFWFASTNDTVINADESSLLSTSNDVVVRERALKLKIPLLGNFIRRQIAFGCDYYQRSKVVKTGLPPTNALMLENPYDRTKSGQQIKLGVWHMAPRTTGDDNCTFDDSKLKFADGKMVIMYLHGCTSHRCDRERNAKYRVIAQLNYHLVTFDYRCFGDSTHMGTKPTKDGLISDALAVYQWILSNGVDARRVVVWGHSLGTAVAVAMLATLNDECNPAGAILESGFTNIPDQITSTIKGIDDYLKYINYNRATRWVVRKAVAAVMNPLVGHRHTNFDSAELMPLVRCPLLFMHAEDDIYVRFELGMKLYKAALANQPTEVKVRAQFYAFNAGARYGHIDIYKDEKFTSIVKHFVDLIAQA